MNERVEIQIYACIELKKRVKSVKFGRFLLILELELMLVLELVIRL